MKIQITNYKSGDYHTLIKLWEEGGLPYKPLGRDSRESIEKEVKNNCNKFLFAQIEGQYVGSVLVTHDGRKGWINRVVVLPEYQHKGIARKLVESAENWLKQQGIRIFACLIEDYNDESIDAFKKMGYIPFEGIRYLTKRVNPDI
ncbi:MAG: GNAT family N-acetyltransferase [Bacteroidetes bacterium]|nr:GNAT family N-acetyltransferase [Bacteroidota bacterium]MBL6942810.1 GNAT family N-acetyltransferase [Bacteroidales bacterium]